MAYITTFQGNTRSLYVNISNDDGTAFNASGYAMWFTVKQNLSQSDVLINTATTGVGANASAAATGLMTIALTSGDTNQCPGIYPAWFTMTGGNPATINTIPTDGFEVVAAPFIL